MILLVSLKILEIKYLDKTREGHILWRILNTYLLVKSSRKKILDIHMIEDFWLWWLLFFWSSRLTITMGMKMTWLWQNEDKVLDILKTIMVKQNWWQHINDKGWSHEMDYMINENTRKKLKTWKWKEKNKDMPIGWHEEYGKNNVTWVLEHGAWKNDLLCGHLWSWTLGDGPRTW